jgi:hypothetical protein
VSRRLDAALRGHVADALTPHSLTKTLDASLAAALVTYRTAPSEA